MRLAEIDPETWVGSRNQKLTFSQPASPTACPPYWRLSDKGRGPMRYAAKSDLGSSDGRISTSCPFFTLPARPEAGLWNDRISWSEDISVTKCRHSRNLLPMFEDFREMSPFGGAPTGR